jgi:hypothetical protein
MALVLVLAGCASGPRIQVLKRPGAPLAAQAIAVYPYAFRWDEPAWRRHAKAMDAVLFLTRQERLLVYGPDDFQLRRADADDPRVGTDLVNVLAERGLPPTGFLALRGWAERRVARLAAALEGKGTVANAEDVTYVAHLEVLDGGGGGVLLELVAEARRDPQLSDPFDPAPELTALHRALVEAAWAELEPRLPRARLPASPVKVRYLPGATLAFGPRGEPSLVKWLASADPAEADLARLAVHRYFDRESADADVSRRMRLPGGLLVEETADWPQLRRGDVIVEIDGRPAYGPQVLQRAVVLAKGGPLELTVGRGSARLPITVAGP